MRNLAVVAFVCVALYAAQGQGPCAPPKVVKTTGTAEIKVTPDRAVIQVGVERENSVASTAKNEVSDTSRKILAALKRLGIDDKDVQTAYLFLQPQTRYPKGHRVTTFAANQSLSVTLHDLSKLDDVMDAVIAAGGNEIDGIDYQSSELRKYRDQARDEAVRAAKEKAEALAKGLGNSIGHTYSIEEVPQRENNYNGLMANSVASIKVAQGPSTAPGEITVEASVEVSFDLE